MGKCKVHLSPFPTQIHQLPSWKNELWYIPTKALSFDLTANRSEEWILDGGYLPQAIIRLGIRRQLRERIQMIQNTSLEEAYKSKIQYVKTLRNQPIAIETATANTQHYEVDTGVLKACLGPKMKYSSCLYLNGTETLGQAEIEMLETYVERAELANGMKILDLGCANRSYVRQHE